MKSRGLVDTPTSGVVRGCDLVIAKGQVVTMDARRSVYASGAVAVDQGMIVAVGRETEVLAQFAGRRVVDAHGGVIHPGFIDGHYHTTIHTTRGVFPDEIGQKDYDVFYDRWFDSLEPDDEFASTQLACLEMLRNGVTFFLEPGTVFEPDAAADAITSIGMRASLADPFVWDVKEYPRVAALGKRAPASLNVARQRLGHQLKRNRDARSLVRGHVALFGSGSASDELELTASALARENSVILNQHQSTGAASASRDDARFGKHPIVHFKEIGVLGDHCTFVHMNVIREDEIEPILASGLSIVWCPALGMNWGAGQASRTPMPELHRQGVNIALGTDMPRFGVGEQPLIGYLLSRDRGGVKLSAEDLLEMSTVRAAKAAGMESELGSLESGKLADIVVRSEDSPESQAGWDRIRGMMLTSRSKSVRTVIVAGEVVIEDGRSTRVDEAEVYRLARESVKRLMARMDLRPEPRWAEIA